MNNKIKKILNLDTFNCFAKGKVVKVAELNAAITILTTANIPYDLSFSPSNGRFAKQAKLKIYITPSITVSFTIQFESGQIAL